MDTQSSYMTQANPQEFSTPSCQYSPEAQATSHEQRQLQAEQSVSRKRARDDQLDKVVEKRGCEEGWSWWTCLMLGVGQENTHQRAVKKMQSGNRS